LRALAENQRSGVSVVYYKVSLSESETGFILPLTSKEDGVRFDQIRARSGIEERAVFEQSVRERLAQLDHGASPVSTSAPTLKITIASVQISELERGCFWGVNATAAASLWVGQKNIWSEVAESKSTHLHRYLDYLANPNLYAQDFREVANDLARQLINGPIR